MKRLDGTVTEDIVRSKLDQAGYSNILEWKANDITVPRVLAIYFDSTKNIIGVV